MTARGGRKPLPRRNDACQARGHGLQARRTGGCICPPSDEHRAMWAAKSKRWNTGGRSVRVSYSDDIDDIAVERLLTGQSPQVVTRAERLEAIRTLTGRGLSGAEISRRLNVSVRTVYRYQALIGSAS